MVNTLKYNTGFSQEPIDVQFHLSRYMDNGRIYIGLIEADTREPYGNLTVNIQDDIDAMPDNYGYVDTNNAPYAEEFITDNELGIFMGVYGYSGYCQYPLYSFDLDKLKLYKVPYICFD